METTVEYAVAKDVTDLSITDRAELGRYEAVIKRGLETFIDVGNALASIRDGNLYRGTHATFLDYCRERWGIGKSQVYRLMNAAEVAGNLGDVSPIGELSESVLRPLTALKPEQQREAYAQATEDAQGSIPTAAQVQKAAAKFTEPKPTPARAEVKRVVEPYQAPTPTPAKVTYLEPRVIVEPDEPATEPTADELEAMALVAVETAGEDAERAERDAHRAPGEAVPTSILTREWVVFVLTGYDPINVDFATALKAATLDDLREALASLTTEEKHWKARLDALNSRYAELMAPPDPRIARAREGIDLINAGRVWVRDNYLELTGREVKTLGYWRDTAGMLGDLESLVDILTGKDVTK